LANCGIDGYGKFQKVIDEKDVKILVNNVGTGSFGQQLEQDPAKLEQCIKLNCYPITLLSKYAKNAFQKRAEMYPQ